MESKGKKGQLNLSRTGQGSKIPTRKSGGKTDICSDEPEVSRSQKSRIPIKAGSPSPPVTPVPPPPPPATNQQGSQRSANSLKRPSVVNNANNKAGSKLPKSKMPTASSGRASDRITTTSTPKTKDRSNGGATPRSKIPKFGNTPGSKEGHHLSTSPRIAVVAPQSFINDDPILVDPRPSNDVQLKSMTQSVKSHIESWITDVDDCYGGTHEEDRCRLSQSGGGGIFKEMTGSCSGSDLGEECSITLSGRSATTPTPEPSSVYSLSESPDLVIDEDPNEVEVIRLETVGTESGFHEESPPSTSNTPELLIAENQEPEVLECVYDEDSIMVVNVEDRGASGSFDEGFSDLSAIQKEYVQPVIDMTSSESENMDSADDDHKDSQELSEFNEPNINLQESKSEILKIIEVEIDEPDICCPVTDSAKAVAVTPDSTFDVFKRPLSDDVNEGLSYSVSEERWSCNTSEDIPQDKMSEAFGKSLEESLPNEISSHHEEAHTSSQPIFQNETLGYIETPQEKCVHDDISEHFNKESEESVREFEKVLEQFGTTSNKCFHEDILERFEMLYDKSLQERIPEQFGEPLYDSLQNKMPDHFCDDDLHKNKVSERFEEPQDENLQDEMPDHLSESPGGSLQTTMSEHLRELPDNELQDSISEYLGKPPEENLQETIPEHFGTAPQTSSILQERTLEHSGSPNSSKKAEVERSFPFQNVSAPQTAEKVSRTLAENFNQKQFPEIESSVNTSLEKETSDNLTDFLPSRQLETTRDQKWSSKLRESTAEVQGKECDGVFKTASATKPEMVQDIPNAFNWKSSRATNVPLSSETEKILATSNMFKALMGPSSTTHSRSRTVGTATIYKDQSGTTVTHRVISSANSTYQGRATWSTSQQQQSDDADVAPLKPEDIWDLSTLEKMLEEASTYDQRRRIRAQIRVLKKTVTSEGTNQQNGGLGLRLEDGGGRNSLNGEGSSHQQVWKTIDTLVAQSLNADYNVQVGSKSLESHQLNSSGIGYNANSSPQSHNSSLNSDKMGDTMWVNGINLLEISDELKLHEMLDRSEDYEDRKIIRARLKEVIAANRAKREEMIRRREEEREEILRQRVRDAEEQKRRTLAMYDAMAKSAPAGANKTMDVGILRGEGSGTSTPTSTHSAGPKVDLVEESIRQRQREADENKKRVLAAYDQAARSGPAGSARFIDFDGVKAEDSTDLRLPSVHSTLNTSGLVPSPIHTCKVNTYESAPRYTSTFQMKGGIPVSFPAKFRAHVNPAKEQPHDSMEEAIRRRQRECDDRKRKTLEAYDKAQRSRPAGVPVSVYVPSTDGIEPVVEVETKALSPRERFQKMDTAVAPKGTNSPAAVTPKPAGAGLVRSPTAIKEMLLNWVRSKTKEYENVKIENFSGSWNDGMAFCALVHHFYPDAFDFSTLDPKNRRHNFELAFRVAEERGDVSPLLDVEDMVIMKKPDWKCVFTYVQSLYRRFHQMD